VLVLFYLIYFFKFFYTDSDKPVYFLNASVLIGIGLLVAVLIYFRSRRLVLEVLWIEILLLTGKAILQVITTLPDPHGRQKSCWDPAYDEYGSWIWTRMSLNDFCGNMIYSGHFYHLILCIIMIDKGFIEKGRISPCSTRLTFKQFQFIYWTIGCLWIFFMITNLIIVRYHYSVDLILALMITLLITTHTYLIDWGVKFLNPNSEPYLEKDIFFHPQSTH